MTFLWAQTQGPTVVLSNADTLNATFTAPSVDVVTALVFTLTVSNAAGSGVDSVTVNVSPTVVDVVRPLLSMFSWGRLIVFFVDHN
jgi:hypothetical protein